MPLEYAYFQINKPLNEIWNKTISFWKEKKAKVVDEIRSPNNLYRAIKIKTGFHMQVYG